MMPSRGLVLSYLQLLLGDGLVTVLTFVAFGCISFPLKLYWFPEQTDLVLHTPCRGQANGMNYRTSRWPTSFPRWSHCRRLTFRWVGFTWRAWRWWGVGAGERSVVGKGREWDWVSLGAFRHAVGSEAGPGVIFSEEKDRKAWTSYEWAWMLSVCGQPGQFCKCVVWFQGGRAQNHPESSLKLSPVPWAKSALFVSPQHCPMSMEQQLYILTVLSFHCVGSSWSWGAPSSLSSSFF